MQRCPYCTVYCTVLLLLDTGASTDRIASVGHEITIGRVNGCCGGGITTAESFHEFLISCFYFLHWSWNEKFHFDRIAFYSTPTKTYINYPFLVKRFQLNVSDIFFSTCLRRRKSSRMIYTQFQRSTKRFFSNWEYNWGTEKFWADNKDEENVRRRNGFRNMRLWENGHEIDPTVRVYFKSDSFEPRPNYLRTFQCNEIIDRLFMLSGKFFTRFLPRLPSRGFHASSSVGTDQNSNIYQTH